jgi:glycosyltransferase involved in cell wall biosynthesis
VQQESASRIWSLDCPYNPLKKDLNVMTENQKKRQIRLNPSTSSTGVEDEEKVSTSHFIDDSMKKELDGLRGALQELRRRQNQDTLQSSQRIRTIVDAMEEIAEVSADFEKMRSLFQSRTWKILNSLRLIKSHKNENLTLLSKSLEVKIAKSTQSLLTTSIAIAQTLNGNPPLSVSKRRMNDGEFGFVQISPIPWNCELFQRPQQMCLAASKLGLPTSYISAFTGDNQPDSQLAGYFLSETPVFIGTSNDLIAELKNNIISFYSTDLFSFQLLQLLRAAGNILVYEYVDAIDPKISEEALSLEFRHKYLIDPSTVDLVVTTARVLEAEMLQRFPRNQVLYLPNAVDTSLFDQEKTDQDIAVNLEEWLRSRDKSRKAVGYVGALAQWLDYEFIEELAEEHPNIDFVFVGPIYDEQTRSNIPYNRNIKYIGVIPYGQVPLAINNFDVCWIPFEGGEIARSTSPLKVFEYFASGKPVLTPKTMLECTSFKEVHQYEDLETWEQAFLSALNESESLDHISRLKELAAQNTWEIRISQLQNAVRGLTYEE